MSRTPIEIVVPTEEQLRAAVRLTASPRTGPAPRDLAAEAAAGRLRRAWSTVAVDDTGTVVGRALGWGRDASRPISVEAWDVVDHVPRRAEVARALLEVEQDALRRHGVDRPLPHTLRLPGDWRSDRRTAAEVDLKRGAAAAAGLPQANERLQFEWDSGVAAVPPPPALRFAPADDETFLRLIAQAATGSLDVMTRRLLETTTPEELARLEVDWYRSCPGERSWWRTVHAEDGTAVGIAIPSATPTHRNVGFLAVLPGHRGRGVVDQILAHVIRFHAEAGAARVTATTDAVNLPMAAALRRAGCAQVETRIELEPPTWTSDVTVRGDEPGRATPQDPVS